MRSRLLLSLAARFTPVHQAVTEEEREAIYRFRYSIYGTELRRDYPGMDHQAGMLRQAEDRLPETRLYYTGSARQITGTARARVWDRAPEPIVEELSLQRVPRVKLAYLERTMVRPSLREKLGMPAMIWHGYEYLMSEGVEVCVLTCVPGLARHYLAFGARTYGAALVEGASSAEVPLIILMNDLAHLRRVKSYMIPQVSKLARPFDPAPFAHLFDGPQPLCFDPREIREWIEAARPALFEGVSPRAIRWIAERAFTLEVPAGGLVVRGACDRTKPRPHRRRPVRGPTASVE